MHRKEFIYTLFILSCCTIMAFHHFSTSRTHRYLNSLNGIYVTGRCIRKESIRSNIYRAALNQISSTSGVNDDSSSASMTSSSYHIPVLRDECCKYLSIKKDGIYVDCTLGGGGHTRAILERGGRVIGLDQDPDAIATTSRALKHYIDTNRLDIIRTNFRHIVSAVKRSSFFNKLASPSLDNANPLLDGLVDGVLMDLGISSHQIDEPTRGFSFSKDGPLDMRMIGGTGMLRGVEGEILQHSDVQLNDASSPTDAAVFKASNIVNEWDSTSIANILYEYGEETRSRQIAREIAASRPLHTTGDLEKVISRVTPWNHRPKTLARCFQALRIAVNDEIGALEEALGSVHQCMKPGAPLVIISYHSLEDRRVKSLFKGNSFHSDNESGITKGVAQITRSSTSFMPASNWLPLFKRAQLPTDEEIERNRRSRSAKVRVALNGIGLSSEDAKEALAKFNFNENNKILKKESMRRQIGKKQMAKMDADRDDDDEEEVEENIDDEEHEKVEEEERGGGGEEIGYGDKKNATEDDINDDDGSKKRKRKKLFSLHKK